MSVRASIITFAVVALLGLAGLLVAGSADERSTAFSIDVPVTGTVTTLRPGTQVCQGPIVPTDGFGSVSAWISPVAASGPPMRMDVRSPGGVTLVSGRIRGGYGAVVSPRFILGATVPAGRPLQVCLTDTGARLVTVLGAAAGSILSESHAGTMRPGGGPAHLVMALLFERAHPRSLLSLLPTVFSRAALFRPGWVGAWTFWLLSAALLGAFGLGALAVAKAVQADA